MLRDWFFATVPNESVWTAPTLGDDAVKKFPMLMATPPELWLSHLGHGDCLFDNVACFEASWAEWCANASTSTGDHMREGASLKELSFPRTLVAFAGRKCVRSRKLSIFCTTACFLLLLTADSTSTEVAADARVRNFVHRDRNSSHDNRRTLEKMI